MKRLLIAAMMAATLSSTTPAIASEEDADRPVRLTPSLGFGWSSEEGVERTALHFRIGALLEIPVARRFSATLALRDHFSQREYVLDRLALSGDALARTRLYEQKVDAEAAFRFHLADDRFKAAVGVGPGFRFLLNSALPASLGGPMGRADVGFALSPSVELSAGAGYTHNLFFKNEGLISAMGAPRSATNFGGAIGLAFPSNFRFNIGYEGEALAMERSVRYYHSVVFLLATTFGGPVEAQPLPVAPVVQAPATTKLPPPVAAVAVVPSTGKLSGTVLSAANKRPLADVIIELPGRTRLLTDNRGAFTMTDLPAGKVSVAASKEGFAASEVTGIGIRGGAETTIEILLTPKPKPVGALTAKLRGTVVSERDKPLDASIAVPSAGIAQKKFPKGEYEIEVPAGELTVEANADGFLKQARRIVARAGETVVADFVLKEVPKRVLVILRKEKIEIKKQVHFATGRDVILPDSFELLDEVASIILENPQLNRIRIEGHTDSQADDAYNLSLSDRRAQAVMRALIDRGVDSQRMTAVGFGETQPIQNNKSATGRAANRRVEFMIEK